MYKTVKHTFWLWKLLMADAQFIILPETYLDENIPIRLEKGYRIALDVEGTFWSLLNGKDEEYYENIVVIKSLK